MMSVGDADGSRTSHHMIAQTMALLVASLLPTFYGVSGMVYATAAALLGLSFLACGISFALEMFFW